MSILWEYIYSHLFLYFFWINLCMCDFGSFLWILPNYPLEILYQFTFSPVGHESIHFLRLYPTLNVINLFNICWGPNNNISLIVYLASIWFLIKLSISYAYWLFGLLLFINFLFIFFCHLSFVFSPIKVCMYVCVYICVCVLALCYISFSETFF